MVLCKFCLFAVEYLGMALLFFVFLLVQSEIMIEMKADDKFLVFYAYKNNGKSLNSSILDVAGGTNSQLVCGSVPF